jgi:hypothetical protein
MRGNATVKVHGQAQIRFRKRDDKASVTGPETPVTNRSQAHNSGRVRRTNDRFTLKTSAPDFRKRQISPGRPMTNGRRHNMLRSGLTKAQQVVVLAGEEGFEPSIS